MCVGLCVCVCVSICVCVLVSVVFTEPHFQQQLPPETILTSSGYKRPQRCPLDSQIVWQRLALTPDLWDRLVGLWEQTASWWFLGSAIRSAPWGGGEQQEGKGGKTRRGGADRGPSLTEEEGRFYMFFYRVSSGSDASSDAVFLLTISIFRMTMSLPSSACSSSSSPLLLYFCPVLYLTPSFLYILFFKCFWKQTLC